MGLVFSKTCKLAVSQRPSHYLICRGGFSREIEQRPLRFGPILGRDPTRRPVSICLGRNGRTPRYVGQLEQTIIARSLQHDKKGQRVNHDAALRPVFDPAGSERLDSTFEPVLNTEEAAALLQVHPKTLQRMARQGVVPAFRIGDLWRFRASDLDRWLRSGLCSKGHSCR